MAYGYSLGGACAVGMENMNFNLNKEDKLFDSLVLISPNLGLDYSNFPSDKLLELRELAKTDPT